MKAAGVRRFGLLGLTFAISSLLWSAPAGAAVTCTYDAPTAKVTIAMSDAGDSATVIRGGGAIQVAANSNPPENCGVATVTNTNRIDINATGAGENQTLLIDLGQGAFAPGKRREATGASEIEFFLNLGSGTDRVRVNGRPTADNFRLGIGGLNVNGDADMDVMNGGGDFWEFSTRGGNDTLSARGGLGTGSAYSRSLYFNGDAGNDALTGGLGRNIIFGDTGADRITGGPGADQLNGDAGADRLVGSAGKDLFSGGPGNDVQIGGDGQDTFYSVGTANDGADDIRGGAGTDVMDYSARTGAMAIDLDNRADDGLAGEHDNVRADIESLQSGSGADRLTGTSANNTVNGGAGADVINGLGGQDILIAGYLDASANTVNGGAGDDSLTGGGGSDSINGGAGDDNIYGSPGNDAESGGGGDDSFLNQGLTANGSDTISGGADIDTMSYEQRTGTVHISLNNLVNDGAVGELDNVRDDIEVVYGGGGADTFAGTNSDDQFYGEAGGDTAYGLAGADTLAGGTGDDTLTGDDGRDFLWGQDNNDTIEAIDFGADSVDGGNGTDECNTDSVDEAVNCP